MRHQEFLCDSSVQIEVEGRVLISAIEYLEAVAGDELDRGGGKADLQAIEIAKKIAVVVVDAAMGFVGN